jgi:phage terminase large subunit
MTTRQKTQRTIRRRRSGRQDPMAYAPVPTNTEVANTALAKIVQLPSYATHLWEPYRYKILWGGRGGARSWTIARVLLLKAAQQKLRILCAREIQSSIRDSVHQLLRDQIDLMELPGFTVTDREIRHANGSIFLFKGLYHNTTSVKSFEGVHIVWVEEAERISKESWSTLIPTIRKTGSEIWVSFNPDQEEDATYQRFILHPPKSCWQQKVNADDNPWLSQELRDERDYAYATDPESADHVWGGNIRRISDAQILRGKWRIEEFTVPTDEHGDATWEGPYQGQDFGFANDPSAAVRLWVHNEVLYVEHEMWKLHLEIDDTATQCAMDIPGFGEYISRADSARPDSISYLKRHGIPRIKPAHKHAGSIKDGIAHLRSYREIVVHPRCKHFIDECKLYAYKVDKRTGDVLPVPVDRHNHLMDSARYALDPLIQTKRKAGFIFANGERIPTCPTCESMLPDDGECPHCGAIVDMDTGKLIDPADVVHLVDEGPAPQETDLTDIVAPLHAVANGNGNGTHNSNGHHHGNGRRSLLRGIND